MWKETFNYDAANNRTSKANGWGKIEYTYNKENQLLSSGNRLYEHDLNGNLTKESLDDVDAVYQYNHENRIIDISTNVPGFVVGKCGSTSKEQGVGYEYDALGRRSTRIGYYRITKTHWKHTHE